MVKPLDKADRRALDFVGRYRVVTRPVLSEVLGSQASADKRVAKLVELELLTASRGLPQRRVAYQLTAKGVAALGLSPARARRFGLQALIKHLGLLFLCGDPVQACERVEVEELGRLLGGDIPDAAYCLMRPKDGVRVALAYVPAPQTPVRIVVRRIRKLGAIIRRTPTFERLRALRRIGVMVITECPERRAAIAGAIRQPGPGGKPPVIKRVRVWVRCVPELARCLGLDREIRPGASGARKGREPLLWDNSKLGVSEEGATDGGDT